MNQLFQKKRNNLIIEMEGDHSRALAEIKIIEVLLGVILIRKISMPVSVGKASVDPFKSAAISFGPGSKRRNCARIMARMSSVLAASTDPRVAPVQP